MNQLPIEWRHFSNFFFLKLNKNEGGGVSLWEQQKLIKGAEIF